MAITPPTTTVAADNIFAAVDMGTNSFKLTVVRTDPYFGRFLTLNRIKEQVLLGLDITDTSSAATISTDSIGRAVSTIRKFQNYVQDLRLSPSHFRLVATSAVREASNKSEFVSAVDGALGVHVDILSGEEEARLVYLGVLQFFPVFSSTVLTIDIGGGSTEFTVGFKGDVLFSESLRLGHVTLTQEFNDVGKMREHIRSELENSGLIESIKKFKLDAVIGSSGTIKAIDKAVCNGYASKLEHNVCLFEEFVKTEWRFTRNELRCLVQRLFDEEKEMAGKVRREQFFKHRAAYILAGTVLLDEIFDILRINEIEVSGYALGEGVITEMLGQAFTGFDLNANARWRSVVRLASRFNNKKRMKAATMCVGTARDIFEGLRKVDVILDKDDGDEFLGEMDLEYLDAACLLHNIGMYTVKKGYHKQSYRAIVNGDQLRGYSREEIMLIAMLVRHHRKKLPKNDVLEGSAIKLKQKFKILCPIMRISYALQQYLSANFQVMGFNHSPEALTLVLSVNETSDQNANMGHPLYEYINVVLEKEVKHFKMVFERNLSVQVISRTSSTID